MITQKTTTKIPQHIAIILDGNRRFAKKHNLTVKDGYTQGTENFFKVVKYVFNKGINIVSAYAFSTENWNRSKTEIDCIMRLGKKFLLQELENLQKLNIKLLVSGRLSQLPSNIQEDIRQAIIRTQHNTGGIMNLCLNYGGRIEIIDAVKKIISNNTNPDLITEQLINNNLYTGTLPDPDIVIRTGGEQRLSGFLTWQTVYSELFFLSKYWPEFTTQDLDNILIEFTNRKRNFGK